MKISSQTIKEWFLTKKRENTFTKLMININMPKINKLLNQPKEIKSLSKIIMNHYKLN
jgi:hypothetical protein